MHIEYTAEKKKRKKMHYVQHYAQHEQRGEQQMEQKREGTSTSDWYPNALSRTTYAPTMLRTSCFL